MSQQLLLAVGQRFPQVKGYGVILLERCDADSVPLRGSKLRAASRREA
ncbi:hypothetical protein [uncultured Nostoc sp.]